MSSRRVLRFEVPGREVLDRLASDPLPAGLRDGAVEWEFFRDRFWDTPDGELARRGTVVRLRVRGDGTATLAVEVREPRGMDLRVLRGAEAPVTDTPEDQLFAGDSEPVRLVRAIVGPERLVPRIELETARRVRRAHGDGDSGAALEFRYDAVTLREGEISTDFHGMEIRLPAEPAPELDGLVQLLEAEYGVRATLADPLGRAREVLAARELEALEQTVRAAREVALIAREGDRVALWRDGSGLRIPTGPGAGEEACRHLLRACFGRAQGQLRLVATHPGAGTRPALQVWLAEHTSAEPQAAPELVWLPLADVLARVGSPELRDARTLVALAAAARTGLADDGGAPVGPRVAAPPIDPAADDEPLRPAGELPRDLLLNMELSVLAFNERVLALAEDPSIPLLERVRFLSIFGSNLDEFFMDRVGGFKRQLASGSGKPTLDGFTPDQQLQVIAIRAHAMVNRAYRCLADLLPVLAEERIHIVAWAELDAADRAYLERFYSAQVDAVLTPLAADRSHPFPHIRNLRPALAVLVRVPGSEAEHFAAIELPGGLPRFVPLADGERFVPLEEVIRASLPHLYPGMEVVEAHTFRVTRSATFSLDEERINDLLQAVEEEVSRRPFRSVIRLETERAMPDRMRALLLRELQFEARDRVSTLTEEDVYPADWLVDLKGLAEIASLPRPELLYPPLEPELPVAPDRSLIAATREGELLFHFPYDSFEQTVERFLEEAADDPDVLTLKVTLYRTARSSRVVRALHRAREQGKEVVALIELKASFDERRNIEWARSLEAAGIHVVYGPPRYKVHAKLALVVRREGDAVRRYLYIGTGNLNAATAAAYTDLGLLSADPVLGDEVAGVFNALTGYSGRPNYRHLLVAPFNMRRRFTEMIEREGEYARAGRGGQIRAKLNGLTDRGIVAALCRASQAGAEIDLVVRGICALRPGVPGWSENIRVVSVLGRFLEHSRIWIFANDGEPEYLIGSADWRPRNLSRRVEVIAPVRDPQHRALLDRIIDADLANPGAWWLCPDGSYEPGGALATGRDMPAVAHG